MRRQTAIINWVASILLLVGLAAAQAVQTSAVIRGSARIRGLAHIITTPPQQTTHIYVFNPPLSNSAGNNNHNLIQNVMNQSAIDGVTTVIAWKQIENTVDPFTGTCGTGVNSDLFQVDAVGYCHTYDWSGVDGTSCGGVAGAGTLLGQFFCNASWTKKVNPLLFGITLNPNSATPEYLWHSSTWNTAVGTQDVVNSLRDDDAGCLGYTGYDASTIAGATMQGNGDPIVTMQNIGGVPFKVGDQIWVKGFSSGPPTDFNMHTSAGTTVASVGPGPQFTYHTLCHAGCGTAPSSSIGTIIGAKSSFPVPTEKPYKTAFRAFIAAAVYHFSHNISVIKRDQVAYMRVGHAYGE